MIHEREKIAVFTYSSPHFCFPRDDPATITQYVAWMERQFNACQTPRSMYLSIFNSFRAIRCVSPKIAIFTTCLQIFTFFTNCLAACTHLSSTVSQLFKVQVQKIAVITYRSPHFCFACDYHAICCMDGKTNSMLAKPIAARTYLSPIVSELYDA